MGKASDVQRQIEELRKETGLLITELEYRAREATDVPGQVRRHPAVAVTAGLALLGGLTLAGYATYGRIKEMRKPSTHRRKRAEEAAEGARVVGKNVDQALRPKTGERSEPKMLKRILYAALTAATIALATYLARRAVETVWTRTMQEKPPSGIS